MIHLTSIKFKESLYEPLEIIFYIKNPSIPVNRVKVIL